MYILFTSKLLSTGFLLTVLIQKLISKEAAMMWKVLVLHFGGKELVWCPWAPAEFIWPSHWFGMTGELKSHRFIIPYITLACV